MVTAVTVTIFIEYVNTDCFEGKGLRFIGEKP